MHNGWRWFGDVRGLRRGVLALGCMLLTAGAVAQVDRGMGVGQSPADPAAWGDWPWRFRDQGASVESGSGWPPAMPGAVDAGPAPVDAGAPRPPDQEYHFRGDPGPWSGGQSGGDATDPYRFRPLTERERARLGDPGWRGAGPGRAEPDHSEGQRPAWPFAPPVRSWP